MTTETHDYEIDVLVTLPSDPSVNENGRDYLTFPSTTTIADIVRHLNNRYLTGWVNFNICVDAEWISE